MTKAVIFDFDNTLMDFMKMKRTAVESAVESMIDAGLPMSKERMIEEINKVYWKEGIEDQFVFDKVLLQNFGQIDYKILASGIIGYRRAKEATMVLYPHVHLTLTELVKMGLKMAVVSDAPRLPVWMRIVSLRLSHFFDCVVTYDDTKETKPSPKPFQKAIELLGLKPEETIMIGDWIERDIVGAKQLGMKTVFARYGCDIVSGKKESGANYDIDDILELVGILKKNE